MIDTKSYLQGGKLGDFIHSLCVCKFNYDFFNYKADLFISDVGDTFELGIENAYNDLKPIIERQEWLNSFKIYNGEKIDINLSSFRQSRYLYTTNWIEIYFNEFLDGIAPPSEYSWIEVGKDENLSNTLLVNRSLKPFTPKINEIYRNIINNNSDLEKVFICFDEKQYENFNLKDDFKLLKVNTLYDFFEKINSCKLFLGNQSGPMGWATSMNAPRIIELLARIDNIHYVNDRKYYQNFNFFQGDTE